VRVNPFLQQQYTQFTCALLMLRSLKLPGVIPPVFEVHLIENKRHVEIFGARAYCLFCSAIKW
jgi:hypothetical protein